jgi:SAM-dependent methyltransferase
LYYPHDYDPYRVQANDVFPLDLPSALLERISNCTSNSINVLDYGCGNGQWLASSSKTFEKSKLYAVDFDKESTTRRLSWLNQAINVISPSEFGLLQEKFHLINFGHSLEHLVDPVATMQVASNLLADNGVISIACPVSNSISFRLFRSFWFALDAPRHFSIPSIVALHNALEGVGAEVFGARAYGSPSTALRSIIYLKQSGCINNSKFLSVVTKLANSSALSRLAEKFYKSSKYSLLAVKTFTH